MIKKIVFGMIIFTFLLPAFADEINMTPQDTFSGANNKGIRSAFPKLNTTNMTNIVDTREDFMKPKSVRQMGEISSENNKKTPMTYGEFPQNYDSSNSMMLMQGGMNNMFMGY